MYVPHYTAPVVIEVVSFEPSARVVEGGGFLVRVTGVKVFSFSFFLFGISERESRVAILVLADLTCVVFRRVMEVPTPSPDVY